MKEKVLNNSLGLIRKYNLCLNTDDEVLLYGLEGLYLTITKLVIIVLVSIILNIFKQLVFVLILFNILRFFAFGFHANNSIECLIFSSALFIGLPYIFSNIYINKYVLSLISIICLIFMVIYAPADTKKRPLINKNKRLKRKIGACIITIIYIVLALLINNNIIANLIVLTLLIQVIMILPITYKIFRQPYRNYKLI